MGYAGLADAPHENDISPSIFLLRVIFLGLLMVIPVIPTGMTAAFNSIALPQMKLNLDEASWFASIISVARPFGCLFTGFVVDKYGRKAAMLSSIVPSIIGWFLLVNRDASLTQLYIGRLLTGFTLGGCTLPYVIYAVECVAVDSARIRSSIITWPSVSMTIGFFLVYTFGAILPYNDVALIAACWSTASFFLILTFVPESPTWLYEKGRLGDAEVAKRRLGIKTPILRRCGQPNAIRQPDDGDGCGYFLHNLVRYCFGELSRSEIYKPLIVTITFLFFAEFSALNGLVSYMVDVITVHPLQADPYVLSVVCGILQVIGCVSSTLILPYSGMKNLSIVSFLGVSIGFLLLEFCMIFECSTGGASTFFNYLHIISVWGVMLIGNMGILVIPYCILGEAFPTDATGYASIPLFASAVFNFFVLKILPYMLAYYRNVIFFALSVICMCGAVFVEMCLPLRADTTDFVHPNGNAIVYEYLSDV